MSHAARRRWAYFAMALATLLALWGARVLITRTIQDRQAANYSMHPRDYLRQVADLRPGMHVDDLEQRLRGTTTTRRDIVSRTYYLTPTLDARRRGVTGPAYYIRVEVASDRTVTSINRGWQATGP